MFNRSARMVGICVAVALIGAMAACGNPDVEPGQPPNMRMQNVGAPLHTSPAELTEELRIGNNTDTNYIFGGVSEVLAVADGGVWVLDGNEQRLPRLRAYDSAGRFVRLVARPGTGPGELTTPTGLAQLPDGRIVLRDVYTDRVDVFTASGDFQTTWLFKPDRYLWIQGRFDGIAVDTTGTVYLPFTSTVADLGGVTMSSPTVVRIRSDGTVVDTVVIPSYAPPAKPELRGIPHTPRQLWAISPLGYFITAWSAHYTIRLHTPTASTASEPLEPGQQLSSTELHREESVVALTRSVSPAHISDIERASLVDLIIERAKMDEVYYPSYQPPVPAVRPPLRGFSFAPDGTLWVVIDTSLTVNATGTDETGASNHFLYDVIGPNGTFVGQVAIRATSIIRAIRGEYVWAKEESPEGFEMIVKYRLTWSR